MENQEQKRFLTDVPLFTLDEVERMIAGALYDMMGNLTTLEKSVSFGASVDAYPAVDILKDFAARRGLTERAMHEPYVRDWQARLDAGRKVSQ